jgi:pimeloyl-ACP methyl ester carboxylesterase
LANTYKRILSAQSNSLFTIGATPMRFFGANMKTKTNEVKLRGTLMPARGVDKPVMIMLPDILEPASNFSKFFNRENNKVLDQRNVWLLDYRNQGESDHHESYDLEEMSDDIVRFMDENKITMATIGGHGFGAKVATVTAINHMTRFTGVINLEGGPVDQRYHEAYLELKEYIQFANSLKLAEHDVNSALKALDTGIADPKWRAIFK